MLRSNTKTRSGSFFCLRHALMTAAAFFIFGIPCLCFALGLAVNPGSVSVRDVPLGEKTAMSQYSTEHKKIQITNKSDSAYTFTIAILPVSKTTSPLAFGYQDIPDVSWVVPEEKEIRIDAFATREVELYVLVPQKKQYADKKYMAILEVKSKKNNEGEMFVVAAQAQIWITTEKKEDRVKNTKKKAKDKK
ncbi:MAG: hypothetical protein HZB36_01580 [Candidatus Omnitrophica bacterium]|nr:hypothetical protein [Candidatus Omnitrophota bacterium]